MWRLPGAPVSRGEAPLATALISSSRLLLLLIVCLYDATMVDAVKLPDIYWNSSNPMFRIDNTDHIIDVNRGNQAYDFDQVDIICPSYLVGTPPRDMETYIIYLASRHEYETCTLLGSSASRLVAKCNGNAGKALKYTITFRSFTPQPGGHEFRPGFDYYLISTSSGRPGGLNQDHGGACREHNMKLIFKVCCDPHDDPYRAPPASQSNTTVDGFSAERVEETTEKWTPFRRLPSASTDVSRIPSTGVDRHRAQAAAGYNGIHRDTAPTRRIFTPSADSSGIGRNGDVLTDLQQQQQQQQQRGPSNHSSSSSSMDTNSTRLSSSTWCFVCNQSHLIWLVIVACIAAALSTVFVIR
ncbi:ephrin-B1-like isoform X2 [Varroa jacobsoni]|uniref:ephrin-B1-like isoform X2 n=1 Tax=Varroa jacobsoni TaxID=62625 RepID=UPI000BFA2E62|nr:ephrin-B1-like isoform X2 [Varroa jacobsoni]